MEIELKECKNFCKECNKKLGYYEDKKIKKTFKREYFSIKPFEYNDKKYFRSLCVDCFYKKHKRLPKSPNVVNYDYSELLGVDISIIKEKNKLQSCTLENFIKRHGDIEGTKKWDIYRERQAKTNTFEYKNKKYGMSKREFDQYNRSRSVTKYNLIKRHGEIEGTKKWDAYVERQRYAGCKKEYFIEKYGEVDGTKKYLKLNKKKKLNLENFIRKYGDKEGKKRFLEFINSTTTFYSKASQKLFWDIYKKLPKKLKEKTYFAELNNEFGVYDKIYKTYRKFDFVISNIKFCIEYNGDHYHANPKLYKLNDMVTKKKGKPSKVIDIWKHDKHKNSLLIKRNFCVIKVWDSDYIENPDLVVKKIINFLKNYKQNYKNKIGNIIV